MISQNSKISIIVPCYNQAQYLDECLQSVQDQTYTHWECIIVNDGSPDNTEEIAKKWVEKDTRFIYLKKENGGVSSARNLGLENAKGDFLQFLDADDCIKTDNISGRSQYFNNYDVIVSNFNVYTDRVFLPGYNKLSLELLNFESILYGWGLKYTIPIHTGLFSTKFLTKFRFNEEIKCFEDWLMWLHITHQNPRSIYIDKPLVAYRKEENIDSASSNLEKLIDQHLLVMPIIKDTYGDKAHDEIIYQFVKNKSVELIDAKKELKKIRSSVFISTYLKIIRLYYNFRK